MNEISKIREQMPVVAADGREVGVVASCDRGGLLVKTVKDGRAFEHVLPLSWIAEVGKYVFLSRSSRYVAAHRGAVRSSTIPIPRNIAA